MPLSTNPRRVRAALGCLTVVALACGLGGRPARAAEGDGAQTRIVHYLGNQKGNDQGKQVMLVAVRPVGSRSQLVLAVPNKDDKKSDYNPIDKVADNVKALKPNDLIQVEIKPAQNRSQKSSLMSVKAYEAKPGELEPNVYVYQSHYPKREGGREATVVMLMKLGEMTEAAVPSVKTESGAMVPDEKVIAMMDGFKGGQLVEVEFAGKRIVTLDPYAAPEPATFVKLTEVDHDGQKVDAVELTVKGKPVTAILSGQVVGKKWATNPKLAATVKRLKPDQEIMARLVQVGDKMWLRYYTAEKKSATATTADDKMPAKEAGNDKKEGEKK